MPLLRFCCLLACLLAATGCSHRALETPTPAPAQGASLTDHRWELRAIRGQDLSTERLRQTPHLIFLEAGERIAGSTGCNRLMGRYEAGKDGRLRLDQLATTKMACPESALEATLLELLGEVASSRRAADELHLFGAGGSLLLTFQAAPLDPSP